MRRLFFQHQPAKPRIEAAAGVSDEAMSAARSTRGEHPSALWLLGVMPRSGTVHVGQILSLHPDLCGSPNQLWEAPFLENTDTLIDFQMGFFRGCSKNALRMAELDMMALFGASFMNYLYSFTKPGQRVLVKETSMTSLKRFPSVFPDEQLMLLMRDGRDLISSSMRTWPKMRFSKLCERWANSARTMLDFAASNEREDYWLVRFEDVLDNPQAFAEEACRRYGLDKSTYPFKEQQDIKVIGSSTMSGEGDVDWSKHVTAPKNFRPTGHWHAWTNKQKRQFKRIAGDELIRAGYAESHNW